VLNRQGYILAFTLALLLGLSFMVGVLHLEGQRERRLIYATLEQKRIYLLALSLKNILWQEGLRRLKEEGHFPKTIELKIADQKIGPLQVQMTVSSEKERLDLNQVDEETLFSFLLGIGISERRARIMAESLLDWRDEDDFHRLDGAERDFYLSLGYEPRNGPLKCFSEPVLIRGFDPYLYWIKPGVYQWVTIYGGQGRLGPDFFREIEKEEPEGLTLQEGGVYRVQLSLKFQNKQFHYLEIFRYKTKGLEELFEFWW